MSWHQDGSSTPIQLEPEYLAAKVSALHSQIKELNKAVEELKEESLKRAVYVRIIGWVAGALVALTAFLSDYLHIIRATFIGW